MSLVQKNLAKLSSSEFLQQHFYIYWRKKKIPSKLKTIVLLTDL